MADKMRWSFVKSCAEKIAKREGRDPDVVVEEMRAILEARGTEIDYGDDLDFAPKKVVLKKPSQAP